MSAILGVLFALHSFTPVADEKPVMAGPAEVKTTAEIVAVAEKENVRGGLRKEAHVSTAEFKSRDLTAFVAWHNPYSGEAATHVYIYVHDAKQGVWVRKLATVFRETHNVAVESNGYAITIRDVKGKAIHRYPEK